MKTYLLPLIILLFSASFSMAQGDAKNNKKLYNPEADAKKDLANAIKTAKKEKKHVLLQIGGNWCGWCIAFDKKVNESEELKKLMNDNYVIYHLSKKRKYENLPLTFNNFTL